REQHRRVEVVGTLFRQGAHGARVGLVERPAIFGRVGRVTRRQGRDEGLLAFARRRRELARALQPRTGVGRVRGVHGRIDVGTEHERRAPPAHGAGGIELRRLQEGALGGVVVEPVGQGQALVEPALHLGNGAGDGEAVVPEALEEDRADRGRLRGRRRGGGIAGGGTGAAAGQGQGGGAGQKGEAQGS